MEECRLTSLEDAKDFIKQFIDEYEKDGLGNMIIEINDSKEGVIRIGIVD